MASTKKKANQTKTLAETVARAIEDDILSGRLRPRDRIIEAELAARFAVSRAPVREALRMIEREGLVARGSRGLQVAEISLDEVREIFEVLADLEELYTRRAISRLTPSDLDRMETAVAEMEAAAANTDLRRYFELNDRFHAVLRDACPNRTLIQLLRNLGKKTQQFRRLAMSMPGRLPRSLAEHQEILAAAAARDADSAGRLARASAENAYVELLGFLQHAPVLV